MDWPAPSDKPPMARWARSVSTRYFDSTSGFTAVSNSFSMAAGSFAGAAVPEAAGAAVVIAEFPIAPTVPTLHRVEITGSALDLAQAATYTFPPCTGPCPPIIAVVARDLDGDHQLDIIAIDSELQVYTALGSQLQLTRAIKLPVTLPTVFEVRTSVTGAPR